MYKKVGSKLNINKVEFYEEIKKSKEQDELTAKALDMLIKMAEHGIRNGNLTYQQKIDEEDCIQSALYDCIKYWRNFDCNQYDNPFAFFTSFIFNGYAKEYKNIYKHRFIKCTKKYVVPYKKNYSCCSITSELEDLVYNILTEISIRDISKLKIKLKCKNGSNWVEFKIGDYSFFNTPEIFGNENVQFDYIEEIIVKVEYNTTEEFMSLDMSGESEIYNI